LRSMRLPNKACTPSLRFGSGNSWPRFASSIFLASGFLCSQAFSPPARQPLTQTVETVAKAQ
jgi:hypothetical protein